MSLKIARQIVELIQQDKVVGIRETLDPYSLDQRRCIMSIKHKHSSLLFIAVKRKSVSIVTYFLECRGADPNSIGWVNGGKLSCLDAAIDMNSETIVSILLTYGANTEVVSSYERTPPVRACHGEQESIIRLLIENDVNVNSHTYVGETPLTALMTYNLNLFKLLISKGTNINLVDGQAQTALMVACKTGKDEIIYFLLSCENIDVRIRNNYGQDALHMAVRYCSEDIVKEIISKGVYTKKEIIKVYELESCLSHVEDIGWDIRNVGKARELWQKALKLRSQPLDTPMFENQHPAGRLQKVVDVLNADDVSALLYLESVQGLNNVFTLGVYIHALRNVYDKDKYLTFCEFYLDALLSGEDRLFFKCISQSANLFLYYLYGRFYGGQWNYPRFFILLVAFIDEIRHRMEHTTPQERMPHDKGVRWLLICIIKVVCIIVEKNEMNLLQEGIKRNLRTALLYLPLKYLIHVCLDFQIPVRIIKCFICCGADVNSTDEEGKTVLHEVVEFERPYRDEIVEEIINNGFDFSQVRCNEYCLPCRMERENIIPRPVKYISLQCLAARTLCEKTMICFSDLPPGVRTIVKSHLFLT